MTDFLCAECRHQWSSNDAEALCPKCGAGRHWSDVVNRPAHYTNGEIECIDAMRAMLTRDEFRGYLRGNSFKYRWRYRHKNGIEDLRKAEWYERKLMDLELEA